MQTGKSRFHNVKNSEHTGALKAHAYSKSDCSVIRYRRNGLEGQGLLIEDQRAAKAGGASRDRTGDLKLAKLALSQLSYGPGLARLREIRWWARNELNVRPHAYQACALTT